MRLEERTVKLLNENILNHYFQYDFATVNLFLYLDQISKYILPEGIEKLEEAEANLKLCYESLVFGNCHEIVSTLLQNGSKSLEEMCKDSGNFVSRNPEKIRSKLLKECPSSFLSHLSHHDCITHTALTSNEKLSQMPSSIEYLFSNSTKHIITRRFKENDVTSEKLNKKYRKYMEYLRQKYEKLSIMGTDSRKIINEHLNDIDIYHYFFLELSSGDLSAFKNYEDFASVIPIELLDFALADCFGYKIVDLDEAHFVKTSEKLKGSAKTQLPSFKGVPERKDDHTKRLSAKRPGGIHLLLLDKQTGCLPIEVQYWNLSSVVYDLFGENNHSRYTGQGKKDFYD